MRERERKTIRSKFFFARAKACSFGRLKARFVLFRSVHVRERCAIEPLKAPSDGSVDEKQPGRGPRAPLFLLNASSKSQSIHLSIERGEGKRSLARSRIASLLLLTGSLGGCGGGPAGHGAGHGDQERERERRRGQKEETSVEKRVKEKKKSRVDPRRFLSLSLFFPSLSLSPSLSIFLLRGDKFFSLHKKRRTTKTGKAKQ